MPSVANISTEAIKEQFVSYLHSILKFESLFYHYTSKEVLINILKNRQIWFTIPKDFPDKTELKKADEYYIEACYNAYESKTIHFSLYNLIKDLKTESVRVMENGSIILNTLDTNSSFESECIISCYSKNNNSQYMWSDFENSDNKIECALEIDTEFGFRWNERANKFTVAVIYGNEQFYETLRPLFLLLDSWLESGSCNPNTCIFMMQSVLNLLKYITKDKEYESEEEIRVLSFIPLIDGKRSVIQTIIDHSGKERFPMGFHMECIPVIHMSKSNTHDPEFENRICEETDGKYILAPYIIWG